MSLLLRWAFAYYFLYKAQVCLRGERYEPVQARRQCSGGFKDVVDILLRNVDALPLLLERERDDLLDCLQGKDDGGGGRDTQRVGSNGRGGLALFLESPLGMSDLSVSTRRGLVTGAVFRSDSRDRRMRPLELPTIVLYM